MRRRYARACLTSLTSADSLIHVRNKLIACGDACAQCKNSWSSVGYASLAATFPTASGEPDWELIRRRRVEDIVPCIWHGPYFYRKAGVCQRCLSHTLRTRCHEPPFHSPCLSIYLLMHLKYLAMMVEIWSRRHQPLNYPPFKPFISN